MSWLTIIVAIVLTIAYLFLIGWIFMLLANWVLGLFSIAFTFTFWQAFGIILLLSFIVTIIKNIYKSK